MTSETVEVHGHLIDSGVLSRVLDDILEYGGDYSIDKFEVGKTPTDESYARLTVKSETDDDLSRLIMRLQTHGVNPTDPGEATLREVEQDGVFPDDFYSTTNLETVVRLGGHWVPVENPEMDCGIVVEGRPGAHHRRSATCMAGDTVVCGAGGVKVVPLPAIDRSVGGFEFMNSEVSSEKPQALLVRQIAQQMRDVKAAGKKILWVGGPAVVHTGAAPAMVALVEAGYVDVLFAGNALATHDIEASLFGTSLGVDLSRAAASSTATSTTSARSTRSAGPARSPRPSSRACSPAASCTRLVTHKKQFVLVGSVRDDGPLPDVYTDVIEGQRAMRAGLHGRRLRDHGRDDAALGRDREHPARVGPAGLRRHQPGDGHQAGRPRLARRRAASSPTSACSSSSSRSSWRRRTARAAPRRGRLARRHSTEPGSRIARPRPCIAARTRRVVGGGRHMSINRSPARSLLAARRAPALALGVVAALAVSLLSAGPAAAAPPANDTRASAQDVGTLPTTIRGTTVEATLEADDPAPSCSGALKGSVWYVFTPTKSRSVVLALDAAGDMDATVEVFTRTRSQLTGTACAVTDRRGEATVDIDVSAGTQYLIRVAPLANSVAEGFTMRVVAPDDPASAPGQRLPAGGVAATVDRLANPDDAWFVDLVQGRTYRLNFVTRGEACAAVELFRAGTKSFGSNSPFRRLSCDRHTVFVASASGRYPILVQAPRASRTSLAYRLRVGPAGADDTAPGLALPVDNNVTGRLRGSELDALDLYRFSVTGRSDMTLRLRTSERFEVTLMTAGGRNLGSDRHVVDRRLPRGRYYVAVRSLDGAGGTYVLRRHARAITSARMLVNGQRTEAVSEGRSVLLTLQVSPAVSGPATMLIERFDPIEGWLFDARFRPTVSGGRANVTFTPSRLGRWRVTGSFAGTSQSSASEGGTARFSVVEPLTMTGLAR